MTFNKDRWIKAALEAHAYGVMPNGRIWRRDAKGVCQLQTISVHAKSGRPYFNMTFRGVTKSVLAYRVVAIALIPNPHNLPEVNHIRGDKLDLNPELLEWADRKTQEKHAAAHGLKATRGSGNSNAKLTVAQVEEIRASRRTPADLALCLNVSETTIRNVIERKTWSHV